MSNITTTTKTEKISKNNTEYTKTTKTVVNNGYRECIGGNIKSGHQSPVGTSTDRYITEEKTDFAKMKNLAVTLTYKNHSTSFSEYDPLFRGSYTTYNSPKITIKYGDKSLTLPEEKTTEFIKNNESIANFSKFDAMDFILKTANQSTMDNLNDNVMTARDMIADMNKNKEGSLETRISSFLFPSIPDSEKGKIDKELANKFSNKAEKMYRLANMARKSDDYLLTIVPILASGAIAYAAAMDYGHEGLATGCISTAVGLAATQVGIAFGEVERTLEKKASNIKTTAYAIHNALNKGKNNIRF